MGSLYVPRNNFSSSIAYKNVAKKDLALEFEPKPLS